jgi:hypothetical protein
MSKPILKRTIGFIPLTHPRIIDMAVENYAWLAKTLDGTSIAPITSASFVGDTKDFEKNFNTMKANYRQMIMRLRGDLAYPDSKKVPDNITDVDARQEYDPIFWAYDIIASRQFVCSKTLKKTIISPESHKRLREEEVVISPTPPVISFNQIAYVRQFFKAGSTLGDEECYLTSTFDPASPCCKELLAMLVNSDKHPATLNTVIKGRDAAEKFLKTGPTDEVHRSMFLEVNTIRNKLMTKDQQITLIPGVLSIKKGNVLILFEIETILMKGLH